MEAFTSEPESTESENPLREFPVRDSPIRENPVRESPVRESPVRESPVRESPERESPGTESTVRRSSIAAARPLRTALSMVSGHPVSVHAPARTRPGSWGGGPRPKLAGAGHLAEGRPPLPGDEELGDPRLAGGREQLGQRGQELLPQRGRGHVHVLVGR